MHLDEEIANLISKHCHVAADGTLAWRGRCYGAPQEFVDLTGCEDRASAAEQCSNISNDSKVIVTLRDLFDEFSPGNATVQSWQAITDTATLTVPHRPPRDRNSSLLASIKARRGTPPPQVVPIHAPVMHPRDRASRGLDVASDTDAAADPVADAPPAVAPVEHEVLE